MAKKKFAAFDIDGTIIRWQLYHAVSDALIKEGHFKASDFQHVKEARMAWKQRKHTHAYVEYENALVKAYSKAIVHVSYEDFIKTVDKSFGEYKEQTYNYTQNLIKKLQKSGYLLFAISASQAELIERFAAYYGFDGWAGSIYHLQNGKFTGEEYILKRDEKPKQLHKLVTKHGATYKDSIAVGDSPSDIPMLEAVENPIVFNPTHELLEHARAAQWKIVVERKNVVYEHNWNGKAYELTTSIS